MIALYLGLLVAWSLVCFMLGALWDAYREDEKDRADMDARDAWMNDYIKKQNKGEAA